jgi:hypothetical protein
MNIKQYKKLIHQKLKNTEIEKDYAALLKSGGCVNCVNSISYKKDYLEKYSKAISLLREIEDFETDLMVSSSKLIK